MKKFIVYFKLKTSVSTNLLDGSFEIEADSVEKAKELANKILDEMKVPVEGLKLADKNTGYFCE